MLQFDYESILADLRNRLQKKLGGNITGGSSANRILEIISEKLAQTVRYAEYLTRESKWSLAQNASSILSQLELFGYTPHRKVGAKGYIRVSASPSFSATYPRTITIPKFSRFSNGELTFCSSEAVNLLSTDTYVDVPVVQGNLMTETFTGADINNYRYSIMNNSIENSLFELTRDSVVMSEVGTFGETQIVYNGTSVSEEYTPLITHQYEYHVRNIQGFEGIELQFPSGDTYVGSETFVFRYLITEGLSGNVTSLKSITTPLDTFTDNAGVTVRLYCENIDVITGGADYESVNEMRENAPLSFNRTEKIITRNDYISAVRSLIGNSVFYMWTEEDINSRTPQFYDQYDFINNSRVFICGCSFSDNTRVLTPISDEDLVLINTSLKNEKGLTDYFVSQIPSIFQFFLTGEVFFDGTLVNETESQINVTDKLTEAFKGSNLEFYKSLYHSTYIALLEELGEIDHVDVRINLYTELPFTYIESTQTDEDSDEEHFVVTEPSTEVVDFGFTDSLDGKFIVTLYNKITRCLVRDLAYTKEDSDGTFKWYDIKDATSEHPLLYSGEDYLGFNETEEDTPAVGKFGNLYIKGTYLDVLSAYLDEYLKENDPDRTKGIEPLGLVVRFVPVNEDAVLVEPNQILTLTDSDPICVWQEPPFRYGEDEGPNTVPDNIYSSNKDYSLIFQEVLE